ncbi:hypothetical protein LEMLEM_LOCUS15431, partial [Lemmus lemmus]
MLWIGSTSQGVDSHYEPSLQKVPLMQKEITAIKYWNWVLSSTEVPSAQMSLGVKWNLRVVLICIS